MLAIITCRNPAEHMLFQNVSNCSFQKCLQLEFPEILATLIFQNVSNHIFINADDKCYQLNFAGNGDEC